MKPNEVLLEYIKQHHQEELAVKCNHKTRIKIDYPLFNGYFHDYTSKNYYNTTNNDKKIIDNDKQEINNDKNPKEWITITVVDLPPNTMLHDLDSSYVGDIVSSKAMIKNITESYPAPKIAVYECRSCMRLIQMPVTDNILAEPTLCSECGGRRFKLNQELSIYKDYRHIKLEEPLEYRVGGVTREFKAYMQDYLASPFHTLKAGDVVDIIGEFKVRKSDKNNKKNDFEFYLDLHSIEPVNNPFEDYRLTDEDKEQIRKLSQEPDIYERLCYTIAPEIYGYETVKEGLVLQMFEGYRPTNDVFKSEYMDRWTSHILLIGDPGIGKSQLVTALRQRTPKQIYVNGANSSVAGLTTTAVKDELTGSWTLEAGAVILADTGILCIDEFDKLSKQAMKSLNQPMEQLTVSSTKAGLVQTMSARTSILAIANPKYSRFNPYKTVNEQINIPDSTLSRFDLVFALNDNIEVEHDTELANALLNKNDREDKIEPLDDDLFKKYVSYAKLEVFPVLTQEAKQVLIEFYVDTRQTAKQDNSSKPITARDLLSLERLTIARAKTELRDTATVDDAKCAIRIYCESLESIGLTPETRGELENVLSDAEIKLVNDTESMIKAQMELKGASYVNDEVLTGVRQEVGVLCYGLGFNRDKIIETAVKNIRKELI